MTPEQKEAVLRIARETLRQEVCGEGGSPAHCDVVNEAFSGCFVTLRKGAHLRGCMGTFKPLGTLAETVERITRLSCSGDPRFAEHRIRPEELDAIDIEVSVLDEPTPTDDPAGLEVGQHGVWVRRGLSSGCLLPQVAVERGWSAEEFLNQCCRLKAGLPADAWRDPDTEVRLFRAEIIR